MYRIKSKKAFVALYWLLSFTWALPTTVLGFVVAFFLMITGHKPKRFCTAFYFPLAPDWGLELGLFFISDRDEDIPLMCHELGHQLQACFVWGPLQIFVITIPSIVRYWYRELFPKKAKGDYLDIWFEMDASKRGEAIYFTFYEEARKWRR